jgi:hypothetical protein
MIHIIIDNHSFHVHPEPQSDFFADLLRLGPDSFKESAEPMAALIQTMANSEDPRVRETAARYIYSPKTRAERRILKRVAGVLALDSQVDVKRALSSNEDVLLGQGRIAHLIEEGDIGILENLAEGLDWSERNDKEDLEGLLIETGYSAIKHTLISNTSTSTETLRTLASDKDEVIAEAAWEALESRGEADETATSTTQSAEAEYDEYEEEDDEEEDWEKA